MSASSWYVTCLLRDRSRYVTSLDDEGSFTLGSVLKNAHRFSDKADATHIAETIAATGREVAVIPFDDVARVGPGPDRPAVHEGAVPAWAVEPLAVAHVLCECDGKVWGDLSTSDIDGYCRRGLLILERIKAA